MKKHRPAHKKSPIGKIIMLAAAAAVVVTALAACALQPGAGILNNRGGQAANAAVASYVSSSSTHAALSAMAAKPQTQQATTQTNAAAQPAASNAADSSGPEQTWHPAWTETVVHPAEYEYKDSYSVYVCVYDGYETTSFDDILAYVNNDDEGFVTIARGGFEVPVTEEWTETIYHPGYWE